MSDKGDQKEDKIEELRQKLRSYIYCFIQETLESLPIVDGKKVIELKQLDIKNQHGLDISECSLIYQPGTNPAYVFRGNYRFSDFLPPGQGIKTFCYVEGNNLMPTLLEFIDHIGQKIYCRDCGKLRMEREFIFEEDQCISCVLETLLLTRRAIVKFCSICQTDTPRYITLRCGHQFHRRCISRLIKNRCPLCNAVIDTYGV